MSDINNQLQPDPEKDLELIFEELDSSKSIKTNYLLVNRNFKKLSIFLKNLVNFVLDFKNSLNPDTIVDEVIDSINQNKLNFVIKPDLVKNSSVVINGYVITRNDDDIFTITRQNDPDSWITENIIVSVKEDLMGVVVYPVVTTKDNYVSIYFIEGIFTNMRIIML